MEVICVAIGSRKHKIKVSANKSSFYVSAPESKLTSKDGRVEILGHWRSILLNVAPIVVEGSLVASGQESLGVFDHLSIQFVEMLMRNHVLNDDETVFVHVPDGLFKVSGIES